MFEKELQTYLKAASSALPCAEARAAFEGYVHCVAQDVCSATSEESFTVVVAQLGSTPEQAARDFMESQSPETIARWKAAAHRHKFRLRLALGLVIGVLVVLVTFFVVIKGVLIINTETTIVNWGDTDISQKEMLKKAMELS